jgi:hypothetical protein
VFQDVWVIKLPWVEVVIDFERKMTQVRCRIPNEVGKKEKTLVPKFDGSQKHASRCKTTFACSWVVVGQYYISNTSQHANNEWKYATFHG